MTNAVTTPTLRLAVRKSCSMCISASTFALIWTLIATAEIRHRLQGSMMVNVAVTKSPLGFPIGQLILYGTVIGQRGVYAPLLR